MTEQWPRQAVEKTSEERLHPTFVFSLHVVNDQRPIPSHCQDIERSPYLQGLQSHLVVLLPLDRAAAAAAAAAAIGFHGLVEHV
jgi:hypothetical protein